MVVVRVLQHTERVVTWTDAILPDSPVEPTEHEKTQTTTAL